MSAGTGDRPATSLYYPSMVVHLGLRFDETLMVKARDASTDAPQLQQASDKQDPAQEAPYLEPLAIPGQDASWILNLVPTKASIELPGIRTAGKFSLTFDYRALPIDPRLMSAIICEIHLGAVDASAYSDGIAGVTYGDTGQPCSILRTRDAAGIPDNDSLLMIGACDTNECNYDGGLGEVHLEGRDLRGLLLDGKIPTGALDNLDLTLPISKVVAGILETITLDHSVTINVVAQGFPSALQSGRGLSGEPSPADAGGLTRVRQGADGEGAKSKPAGGDKLSYWDLITNYCMLVGAVPYFQGQTLMIRPARDIYAQLDPANPTPFADGLPRQVDEGGEGGGTVTKPLRVRRLVYGRNIESLSYQRKYQGGAKVPVVEVVGIDDTVRGEQKLIVEQWPPADSDAAKRKGEGDRIRIPVHGVRSRERLRTIAQDLYEEIGRGEIGGTCKTKSLSSFGAGNEDPDMLRTRPTDAVELSVDVRSLSSRAPLVSELTGASRRPFDEQVKVLTGRLGDVNLARALVATARSSVVDSLRWFRTSSVRFEWGVKEGVAIAFDFQNYIVPRHGAEATAATGGTAPAVSRKVVKKAAEATAAEGAAASIVSQRQYNDINTPWAHVLNTDENAEAQSIVEADRSRAGSGANYQSTVPHEAARRKRP